MNKLSAMIVIFFLAFSLGMAIGAGVGYVKHAELKGKVEQNNRQAKERLAVLIKERDKAQDRLNSIQRVQEAKDNEAKAEIERLNSELASRPIRVRVEPRACGGGCQGGESSAHKATERSTPEATGLLPKSNSRRLRAAIKEVELLSAAYNSCASTHPYLIGE